MVIYLLTILLFIMKKFSLKIEEDFFFSDNERWKAPIHKNEYEIMESILPHALTYFLTSYRNQVFFFLFFILLSNGGVMSQKLQHIFALDMKEKKSLKCI